MRKIRTYLAVTVLGLSHTENHTAREIEKSNGFPCKFSTTIFYFVESRIMCEVIFPSHSSFTGRKKKKRKFQQRSGLPNEAQEKHVLGSTPVLCAAPPLPVPSLATQGPSDSAVPIFTISRMAVLRSMAYTAKSGTSENIQCLGIRDCVE